MYLELWIYNLGVTLRCNFGKKKCLLLLLCGVGFTQGFKVDNDLFPKHASQGLRGLDLDAYFFKPNLTGRQYMEIMANVAIDKYNQVEASTTILFCFLLLSVIIIYILITI